MGYTSDVRISMTKDAYEVFKKYVDEKSKKVQKEGVSYDYNLLNHTDVFKSCKGFVYFGWDWIKWYGDSDIDIIKDGLDYIDELFEDGKDITKDYSYVCEIAGEDYDDFEYRECGKCWNLNPPEFIRKFDDDVIDNYVN